MSLLVNLEQKSPPLEEVLNYDVFAGLSDIYDEFGNDDEQISKRGYLTKGKPVFVGLSPLSDGQYQLFYCIDSKRGDKTTLTLEDQKKQLSSITYRIGKNIKDSAIYAYDKDGRQTTLNVKENKTKFNAELIRLKASLPQIKTIIELGEDYYSTT